MRLPASALLILSLQLVAWGQMDDNTLTVAPSRTITLQPDQLTFSVNADFESTAGLADVLSAVQSVGITEANLSGVSTFSQSIYGETTQWSFVLAVPFSKQADSLSALAALQKTIGANSSRSLNYSIQGARVSPQLQASATCPYAALYQDAVAQAQELASAVGQMLGPVLTVSDGGSTESSQVVVTATFRSGNFSINPVILDPLGGAGLTGFPTFASVINNQIPASTSQSCTLVVQFKLLH